MTVEVTQPRRRLHPLTPLLRGFRLAVLIVVGLSWRGLQDLGVRQWVMGVIGVAILALIASVVSYFVTGYHIVGRELRVYEGLLFRRTRAIPLERLQSVEIVRPLVARLLGLAVLKLEVVGGGQTEAPLSYLSESDAVALRRELLRMAKPATATSTTAAAAVVQEDAPVGPAEQPVHRVANKDLFISQLLRPQWLFLPLAVAFQVVWFANDLQVNFIAIGSTVTAIVGIVLAPVRTLLSDWNFTVATSADGLRIRRGLTETRSQTLPVPRVQAVVVEWPLWWRFKGWARARVHVAGVSVSEAADPRSSLLPVGAVPVVEQVVAEALPGFALTSVAVHPVPAQARWIAPLRRRVLGFQVTDTAFVTRDGVLTRRLAIVPYQRIQSVRVTQGPLQRRLGLASVWVDPAGGLLNEARAVAAHRSVAEARALADDLAARARAARR